MSNEITPDPSLMDQAGKVQRDLDIMMRQSQIAIVTRSKISEMMGVSPAALEAATKLPIVEEKLRVAEAEILRLNEMLKKRPIAADSVEPSQEQVTALLRTESGKNKLEVALNTSEGQAWLLSQLR